MTQVQITKEQGAANQIKGLLMTLELYRATSMRMHNRLVSSVYELAQTQRTTIDQIYDEYPDSRMVERWYRKYDEYITQHNLI